MARGSYGVWLLPMAFLHLFRDMMAAPPQHRFQAHATQVAIYALYIDPTLVVVESRDMGPLSIIVCTVLYVLYVHTDIITHASPRFYILWLAPPPPPPTLYHHNHHRHHRLRASRTKT
ncbi:hypothetical protein B0T26DRAFT_286665 [Lasiosphaeria miniovina]|uniref:Uncharacterized protein n=1 Tax=Lasiosphaeria miniovina TaxID=1954250 RepID=A0AA40DY06_9PEZI|nr:uncharacterized protein B0T26DRAFT_286665 [Lasiosphaeria miniovina]KAK0717186.1 hypothetical protein B0T26DRAFT_286665 [Lasiosphaeria miniovina]